METTTITEGRDSGSFMQVKRIYWGAVFAGALVMLVVMMMLNLLGFGIGVGSINPVVEKNPFSGLGTATLIWWIISNIIAIFAGGYVAGRLAGVPHRQSALLHGIVSWSLYTIFSFWLFTTAIGAVISGAGSVVSGTFSGLKDVVTAISGVTQSDALQNLDLEQVEQEINKALEQLEVRDTLQALRQDVKISRGEIVAIARKVFIQDGQLTADVSQEEIIRAVTSETNISEDLAREVARILEREADNLQQDWEEVKQVAERTGGDIASAASSAAIWAFVALIFGALSGALGGMIGKPAHFLHEELYERRVTTTR